MIWTREGWGYFLVSALALLIDYATFVLVIRGFGTPYLLANVCGFVTGVIVHYATSVWWVFSIRRLKNPVVEFLLFGLSGLGGLAINSGILVIGIEWLRLSPEAAKLVASGTSFVINFLIRKVVLFT